MVSLKYLADTELFPKVKKMAEGSESARTAATGARTVPPLSKAAESCRVISSFSTDNFAEFFSPRAMDRGGLFAMEGFVDGVEVSVEESGAVKIQGRCYASFRKNLRRPVEISLNSKLSFTDSLCTCTAGQNNCAHAAGVLGMSVSLFSQSIKLCRTVVIPYPSDIMTVSPLCTILVHLLCISQRLPLDCLVVCNGQLVVVLLVASQFVPTLE